jgi:hypothetical protein
VAQAVPVRVRPSAPSSKRKPSCHRDMEAFFIVEPALSRAGGCRPVASGIPASRDTNTSCMSSLACTLRACFARPNLFPTNLSSPATLNILDNCFSALSPELLYILHPCSRALFYLAPQWTRVSHGILLYQTTSGYRVTRIMMRLFEQQAIEIMFAMRKEVGRQQRMLKSS